MAYVNDFGIVTITESSKSIARRERERERDFLLGWRERIRDDYRRHADPEPNYIEDGGKNGGTGFSRWL